MFSRKNPMLSITAPPALNTTWCIPSSSLLHTSRALWISFLQFASSVDDVLSALFAIILHSFHSLNRDAANSSVAYIFLHIFVDPQGTLLVNHYIVLLNLVRLGVEFACYIQVSQNNSTSNFAVGLWRKRMLYSGHCSTVPSVCMSLSYN